MFGYFSTPAHLHRTPPTGAFAKDQNDWLQRLNCVAPYTTGHNCETYGAAKLPAYSSKVVAYGGVTSFAESNSSLVAFTACLTLYRDRYVPLCLTQSLLDVVFLLRNDGIVPYDSAVLIGSRAVPREMLGYDHSQMVTGRFTESSNPQNDPLFGQIKRDLLDVLETPPQPSAKITLTSGGRSGNENVPLTVTVPSGVAAVVACSSERSTSSVGSITSWRWQIDESFASSDSSFSRSLPAGVHTITLEVTTNVGQTSAASATVIVQEQAAPTARPTASRNAASEIADTSAVLNALVAPNAASAAVWFEWGTTTAYGQLSLAEPVFLGSNPLYSKRVSNLSPGDVYHVRVLALNEAGLSVGDDVSFTTAAGSDVAPPTVTITSPTSASSYTAAGPEVSLAGLATDDRAVTSVTWVNDRGGSGTATGTGQWLAATVAVRPGTNVITVTAWDASGNSATDTLTVTYDQPDNVSPTTTILSGPTGTWTSSSFTFAWTGNDDVTPSSALFYTTHLVGLDESSTPYATTTTRTFSAVPNGTYTFWARARDTAGNIDYSPPTVTFTVNVPDTSPPVVSDLFLGGGGANNDLFRTGREYHVVFAATDDIRPTEADLSYSATGSIPWTPIANALPVVAGPNVFAWRIPSEVITTNGALRIVVRDAAGNSTAATFGPFTVRDGTAPTVKVVAPSITPL